MRVRGRVAGGRAGRAVAVSWVLAAWAAAAGCGGESGAAAATGGEGDGEEREAPAVLIRTGVVETADLARGIRATATIESERHTTLSMQTAGQVIAVLAEIGQEVREGEVLLRLDTDKLTIARDEAKLAAIEAAHRAAEAALALREVEAAKRTAGLGRDEAEANLKRTEELSRKALVSEGDLDAARYARERSLVAVESAGLAYEKAKLARDIAASLAEKAKLVEARAALDLENAELKAPFAGVIAARAVRPGDNAAAGQAVFELADPARLVAPVFLPQKNLGLLRAAMRIEVRADALPGVVATGSVKRLPRTVDAASGNVRLDVVVEDPRWAEPAADPVAAAAAAARADAPPPFLPGMFVTLRLVTEEKRGVPVVPKKATRLEGEGALVYRIEDGIAREVRFQPGLEDQDRIEVTGGALRPGDRIALVGVEQLKDGVRVRDAAADAPGAPGAAAGDGAAASSAAAGAAARAAAR